MSTGFQLPQHMPVLFADVPQVVENAVFGLMIGGIVTILVYAIAAPIMRRALRHIRRRRQ